MNMYAKKIDQDIDDDTLQIHLDPSSEFLSNKNVLKTEFLTFFRTFQFGFGPIIKVKNVAMYSGDFGIFLNATCKGKEIGIGVHPDWLLNEDGNVIGIDQLNYVLQTKAEMKAMMMHMKSKGKAGERISPPADSLVLMDEFEHEMMMSEEFSSYFMR